MNRREFLAAVAAARSVHLQGSTRSRFGARPTVTHLDARTDIFACEREAQVIEEHMYTLLQTRALPLSPHFTGVSPIPAQYKAIDENIHEAEFSTAVSSGFEAELGRWIDTLG